MFFLNLNPFYQKKIKINMKECYGYRACLAFSNCNYCRYLLSCGKLNYACRMHVYGTEIDLVFGNNKYRMYKYGGNGWDGFYW